MKGIMPSYLDNLARYDEATIQRGRAYFEQGLVNEVQIAGNEVKAKVEGSERYEVRLSFDGEKKIIQASCSCPCQFPCKHQVALLYKLDAMEKEKLALHSGGSYAEMLDRLTSSSLRHDYAAFHQAGLALYLNLGKYRPDEATNLVSTFLSNFGSFSYARSYDWPLLAGKLIAALAITNTEKTALFGSVLDNPQVSLLAKKALFNAFADDPLLAPLFDPAFLGYHAQHPAESKRILEEAHYHTFQADRLTTPFLILLLDEGIYFPRSVDLSARLPQLTSASTEEEITSFLSILHYLIENEQLGALPPNALASLQAIGKNKEAQSLAKAIFLRTPTLESYLAYRIYLPKTEIASTLASLKEEGGLKNCLDAILLYEKADSSLGEPHLDRISFYDLYLCKDRIDSPLLPEVIEALKKKFDVTLKEKRPSEEWRYGLLLLDQLGQKDLVAALLGNDALEAQSLLDPHARASYLTLLSAYHLEQQRHYCLYPEER